MAQNILPFVGVEVDQLQPEASSQQSFLGLIKGQLCNFPFSVDKERFRSRTSSAFNRCPKPGLQRQIEDLPKGYPQFAVLSSSHPSFQICRRFSSMRARLLLLKQDRLSQLEKQLDNVDRQEQCPVYHGSVRMDKNINRKTILQEFDKALADYDGFISRGQATHGYPNPENHAIVSLSNWLDNTGSITEPECEFLTRHDDLAAFTIPVSHSTVGQLEEWLARLAIGYIENFRSNPNFGISSDDKVRVYAGGRFKIAAQCIIAAFIVLLLFVPVALLQQTHSSIIRNLLISSSAVIFIVSFTAITKAKPSEMFIAGTTYAAVLVVFVSGANAAA